MVQLSYVLVTRIERHHSREKAQASLMLKLFGFNLGTALFSAVIFLLEFRLVGAQPIGQFAGEIIGQTSVLEVLVGHCVLFYNVHYHNTGMHRPRKNLGYIGIRSEPTSCST